MPNDPQKRGLAEAQRFGFGGIGNAALEAGNKAVDVAAKVLPPEIAAGVGVLGNMATQAIPMLMGGGKNPNQLSATEPVAKWLMNKAVKASTDDVASGAAAKAYGTMLRENQSASPSGMVKAQKIVNEMHPQVQAGIERSSAEIPIAPVGEKYLEQYTRAIPQGESAIKEVGDVWKNFSGNPAIAGSESMTAQMADLMKRGAQKNARASYGKPTGEAEKELAALLREELLKGVPSIRAPLAREAANMNVLDVARGSIAQSTKNNPGGLSLLANDVLPAAGFLADRSPYFKGLLARMLYQGGKPGYAVPAGVAGSEIPGTFQRD